MSEVIYYKPKPDEWYVYLLCNPLKEGCPPYYIGKGKGLRAFHHPYEKRKTNPHKHNTIRQIKEAGLPIEIRIAYHSTDEAKVLWVEEFMIALYGRKCDGGILTNIKSGGEGGGTVSEETKQRMSEAGKGRVAWNKGINMPPGFGERMSLRNTGRKASDATKAKISKSLKGRPKRTGRKASEESRNNMRKAQVLRRQSEGDLLALLGIPHPMAGRQPSPATKLKISQAHLGKKHSADRIEQNRLGQLGRKHTDQAKQNMKAAQQKRRQDAKALQSPSDLSAS